MYLRTRFRTQAGRSPRFQRSGRTCKFLMPLASAMIFTGCTRVAVYLKHIRIYRHLRVHVLEHNPRWCGLRRCRADTYLMRFPCSIEHDVPAGACHDVHCRPQTRERERRRDDTRTNILDSVDSYRAGTLLLRQGLLENTDPAPKRRSAVLAASYETHPAMRALRVVLIRTRTSLRDAKQ